jgi:ribosomal protein S6E (S10)
VRKNKKKEIRKNKIMAKKKKNRNGEENGERNRKSIRG